MKQHSKKTPATIMSAAIIFSAFSPLALFAQTNTGTPSVEKGFCATLPEFSKKTTDRLTTRSTTYDVKKAEGTNKITDNRAQIDAKIKEIRSTNDARRDAQAAKLTERATTPEQKTAVETFVSTLHDAIAARRAAVDAAREAFRTGVDKVRSDRKTAVENAFSTFKTSVNTALEKATTDCTSGVASKTVRTQTISALKSARTALQTTMKGIEKNKTSVEALKTSRNTAIKKAQDDFKAALEKAKTDLKAAFPEA